MSSTGIVVLAVAIVLVLLWPVIRKIVKILLLRTVVRMALKDVGDKAMAKQPDEVHLVHQEWSKREAAEADRAGYVEPLKRNGFSVVGLYAVQEMPGVDILQMVNEDTSVYANLYSHAKAGKWCELVSRYQDGRFCSFSTLVDRGLEQRPGDVHVHAPMASAGDLYERMLQERPDAPLIPLTSDSVPRLFEKGYQELMFWRKQRGLKPEEVAKVAVSLKRNPIGKSATPGK